MATQLPKIVFDLPGGKLPEHAVKAIQEYRQGVLNRMLETLPEHQRQQAFEMVIDDLQNNDGREFGAFFKL